MSKIGMRSRLLTNAALAGALCAVVAATSATAQTQTVSFDIPAEPLGNSLRDFARESGQQIIFTDDLVAGKTAPALHGTYAPEEALSQLLRNSGLVMERSPSGSIMVRPKNAEAASNDEAASPSDLETVVVTGTHIDGGASSSPVIAIDRQDIARSGYTTAGAVIRNLPQSFGGGQNIGTLGAGGVLNAGNISDASTANLRGLGSESTLTLVNGQRLSYDGITSSVDVSAIPVSAIDRVDVLTDGASAIYGSDAVAGVVNFVLRQDYDGLEARATLGGATDGGGFSQQYDLTGGKNWDGGNVLLSYEFAHQDPVHSSDRDYISPTIDGTSIYPSTNRNSLFGAAHQDLAPGISIFFQGLYTNRGAHDVNNDGFGDLTFTDAIVNQFGALLGLNFDLGSDWKGVVAGNASGSHDTSNLAIFSVGIPRAGQTPFFTEKSDYDNELRAIDANFTGPLLTLPTGDVRAAIGGGYRHAIFSLNQPGTVPAFAVAARDEEYAYIELQAPLVAPSETRTLLHSLVLSAAARYENYSDFGDTLNPKVGLIYAPTNDLNLTASWGTSFRAPSLLQQHNPTTVYLLGVPNLAGNTVPALFQSGGNAALKPEKSTSYSFSAHYQPSWMPDLAATVTYFNIAYRDRIGTPLSDPFAALVNDVYAPFVVPTPSAATQAAVISQAALFQNATEDPYDPSLVAALIDDRYHNFSSENADGVDVEVRYHWLSDFGAFDANANFAVLNLSEKFLATSPSVPVSGTVFNPPHVRGRGGLTWSNDNWSTSVFVNYTGPSEDPSSVPAFHVSSWTTADAQVSYAFGSASGTRLAVTVQNLFDTSPPFVEAEETTAPGLHYDSTNASALGRFVSVELVQDW